MVVQVQRRRNSNSDLQKMRKSFSTVSRPARVLKDENERIVAEFMITFGEIRDALRYFSR